MNENVHSFTEAPLLPEATALLEDFARLEIEHPQACQKLLAALATASVDLQQLVRVLSRNKKIDLLEKLDSRIATGVRSLALSKHTNVETTLTALVAEVENIWERRR